VRRAEDEAKRWPYAWLQDPKYPAAWQRGVVSGKLVLQDRFAPGATMSNVWVGLTAADWLPTQVGFGGGRRFGTNFTGRPGFTNNPAWTNAAARWAGGASRNGFPALQDWQRDSKHYQFWVKADADGRFVIPHVRPGRYWLRAIGDGVIGEFVKSNVVVNAGFTTSLNQLNWQPVRYGRSVWEIGVPDRTAREFRHGDHYWQWGLYFKYVEEFPNDVDFVVGQSDWRRDWNYVQPPRIRRTNTLPMVGEEDEVEEAVTRSRSPGAGVESSVWKIRFQLDRQPKGRATLRLAFCGTHQGCNVEVRVNGASVGETGTLPSTSAMQRDGIQAFWIEKLITFDASRLQGGENMIQLKSHANTWSQGVMYDCVRLEIAE
jgi:rhamnogalacturonan endolyase